MKKLISMILITMIISINSFAEVNVIEYIEGNDTFKVNYEIEDEHDYIIYIVKGKSETYFAYNNYGDTYNVPSEGEYTIYVLRENDGEYRIKFKQDIRFSKSSDKKYLNSTSQLKWNDEMDVIKHFKDWDISDVYMYLKYNLEYDENFHDDKTVSYSPTAQDIYDTKAVVCNEITMLFSSIARSNGIPCKIVYGYLGESKVYHAWNEVYVDGEWKVIDLTLAVVNRSGTFDPNIYVKDTSIYEREYDF